MATFVPTELFGGAMSAQLPASWQDMNDLGHPVPDNQEVWCERAGGAGGSLVIEIVERADVDDAAAPAYFWNDIADASGAVFAVKDQALPGIDDDEELMQSVALFVVEETFKDHAADHGWASRSLLNRVSTEEYSLAVRVVTADNVAPGAPPSETKEGTPRHETDESSSRFGPVSYTHLTLPTKA